MMTALKTDLLAEDPTMIEAVTEALGRLASGEDSEADRQLFDLLKVVSIGIDANILVATRC